MYLKFIYSTTQVCRLKQCGVYDLKDTPSCLNFRCIGISRPRGGAPTFATGFRVASRIKVAIPLEQRNLNLYEISVAAVTNVPGYLYQSNATNV